MCSMNNDPKRECPDNCRYRSRIAPFCGFCMREILAEKREENEDGDRQEEGSSPEQDQ